MSALVFSVNPYTAYLIHGLEVEEKTCARLRSMYRESTAVPEIFVWFKLPANTGQDAFRRKGNKYSAVKAGRA